MGAAVAALALAVGLSGPATEPMASYGPAISQRLAWGNVDNLRFGLTAFQDVATATLFAGRQGISLGADYNLGSGFAVGADAVALYKDFDGVGYLLAVTPLQLKYRVGLPLGNPAAVLPYATVGAGPTFMGMLAGSTPQAGIGYSGTVALGALVADAFTIEVGYGGGRVANITDYGFQLRIGTAFDTLGDLPFWSWRANARAQAPAGGGGGPEAGVVDGIIGDRLVLVLPPDQKLTEGTDVLIYVEEGITIKVARARIEGLSKDGRAVAQVVQAMEPIKLGYRVRAW